MKTILKYFMLSFLVLPVCSAAQEGIETVNLYDPSTIEAYSVKYEQALELLALLDAQSRRVDAPQLASLHERKNGIDDKIGIALQEARTHTDRFTFLKNQKLALQADIDAHEADGRSFNASCGSTAGREASSNCKSWASRLNKEAEQLNKRQAKWFKEAREFNLLLENGALAQLENIENSFVKQFLSDVIGLAKSSGMLSAKLKEIHGEVSVEKGSSNASQTAKVGEEVFAGTTITTERNSFATLEYEDGSIIQLGPSSSFRIADEEGADVWTLIKGKIRVLEKYLPEAFRPYRIRTLNCAMAVRGTEYILEVKEDGSSELTVLDGSVECIPIGKDSGLVTNMLERTIVNEKGDLKAAGFVQLNEVDRFWERQDEGSDGNRSLRIVWILVIVAIFGIGGFFFLRTGESKERST